MLRQGICQMKDWNGSAVDFLSKGLARFCHGHGLAIVSRVFPESTVQLLDEITERNEYERSQSENIGSSSRMFLIVYFHQAAMVQIGPTLSILGSIHDEVPAAFFQVFATNLSRWMRVYDFRDAETYADDQIQMLDEDELKESFYPQVKRIRPACLKKLPRHDDAVERLKRWLPKGSKSRAGTLIRKCLELDRHGEGHALAYPSHLGDTIPEMEDYLENTGYPGPGSLIVFEEDDAIEACFNEEMQYLGQNYEIGATAMLLINLDQRAGSLDREVQRTFEYLGAMVRCLAVAAELIELIRGIYDEHLRQRRLESGVQARQGAVGVRGEFVQ
jgi:hypothetical protein